MTLFPEWVEEHKKEFLLPRRIVVMHSMYGKADDRTCKTCKHLRRYKQSARWMKCLKAKITGGSATDWKAGFPACGLYEEVINAR